MLTRLWRFPVTYAVILVGCYGGENGFAKYKGLVSFLFQLSDGSVGQVLALLAAPKNQVNAGLVFVHRVQNDLLQVERICKEFRVSW